MKISLRGVSLAFEDKPPLFRGIDLEIGSEDYVLVQGPSGCGKSSLLRLLNRLQEPTEGELLLDGEPAHRRDVTRWRRSIGYLQQTPVMVDGTVRENLLLPFSFRVAAGEPRPSDGELRAGLDRLLLGAVDLDADAATLSVGQKQRVALVRSTLAKPQMLLCDEPTSALDAESREVVMAELERLHLEEGVGIVLVTHVSFQAKSVRPRTYAMDPAFGLKEVTV